MKKYEIDGTVCVTRRILLARLEDLLFVKVLLEAIEEHTDYIYDVHNNTAEDGFGYRYVVVIMYNPNDKKALRFVDWVFETIDKNVENCIVTDFYDE